MPLFKNITIVVDGSPVLVPRTLKTIDELDKSSGGVGYGFILNRHMLSDSRIKPAEEFHYAVLTKDVLPGSRGKDFGFLKKLVETKGYEMPPVLDAVTAILWENRRTGERLLGKTPTYTYTRCLEEKLAGCSLIIGASLRTACASMVSTASAPTLASWAFGGSSEACFCILGT